MKGQQRKVAQSGRALALGARGREFESRRLDQFGGIVDVLGLALVVIGALTSNIALVALGLIIWILSR
jgi:hypothetical protein